MNSSSASPPAPTPTRHCPTKDRFLWVLVAALALCRTGCGDDDEDVAPATADASVDTGDATDSAPADALDQAEAVEHPFADSLLLSDRLLNIAHRGGGRLAPEETLVALENAVEVDADVLELDVHATSDGVIVVMHNDTVDATTDGSGKIVEMTFEELRQLDAGYHFTPDGGETFPYRGQGVVVPTLEEVLSSFPEMHFVIEVKQEVPSIASEVVALVEEAGMESRVAVASFSDGVVAELRAANPNLITGLALGEVVELVTLTPDAEASYDPPGQLLQVPPTQAGIDFLDPDLLARAHRHGLRVQIWTINDRDEMQALIALDIDGIMTDDPAMLAEVIEEADPD